MKRKGRAALIAALTVVAIGIVVSYMLSLSLSGREQYTITLPGQGTAQISDTHQLLEENREIIQTVAVNRDNVQSVIARLSRPEVYQCTLDVSYYYGDDQADFQATVACLNGIVSDRVLRADGSQAVQALITSESVYLMHDSGEYSVFPKLADDDDLYACTPTYENILNLPRESILDGAVEEVDGHLCISVTTRDRMTGERSYWRILADNGLLFSVRTELSGKAVYRAQLRTLSLEEPDATLFRLPDGELPTDHE